MKKPIEGKCPGCELDALELDSDGDIVCGYCGAMANISTFESGKPLESRTIRKIDA